jgi:hypothetical protein
MKDGMNYRSVYNNILVKGHAFLIVLNILCFGALGRLFSVLSAKASTLCISSS